MTVEQSIEAADQYFNSGNFFPAAGIYANSFAEITSNLSKASSLQTVAKVGGWVAAFLTGGIGLEDVVIVPLVNKALLSLFGVDLKKSTDLADRCLCGMISCAPQLQYAERPEITMLLNYYLMLYKMRLRDDQKSRFQDILELVNPFSGNNSLVTLSAKLSRTETETHLLQVITENFKDRDELNLFLLETLYKYNEQDNLLYQTLAEAYSHNSENSSNSANQMTVKLAKEILGIPADIKSITKTELMRFRNAKIKDYHPDKYHNFPKEFIEVAEKKSMEINEAYEYMSLL